MSVERGLWCVTIAALLAILAFLAASARQPLLFLGLSGLAFACGLLAVRIALLLDRSRL